jgi:hypothetical protein
MAMAKVVLQVIVQHGYGRRGRTGLSSLFQRICCFLFMRLAMISLTALSTDAVEIGSPRRRRAA